MKILRSVFNKLIVIVMALTVVMPAYAIKNIPMPEIVEDIGWATPENRELFISQTKTDLQEFFENFTNNIVPIEAKVGIAFMNAFSHIGNILNDSLGRFAVIFILIMFIFWLGLEAYNLISGRVEIKDALKSMLKKGGITAIWVVVLNYGPVELFMAIMNPILTVASYICDIILNAVSSLLGGQLFDTCANIHQYAAEHVSPDNLLKAEDAASIMCMPTRISGFCYTAIGIGVHWMLEGLGTSLLFFLCGVILVAGFLYMAWKFAFIAFGVIADLFLGIIMLPFTAISECVGATSYKGLVGDIYNGFIKLFTTESLQAQFMRFINAALHFIVLAVIGALCMALLSNIDLSIIQSIADGRIWSTMLGVALTWYLASHASEIASEIGGAINTSMGDSLKSGIKTVWSGGTKIAKDWYKIIKDSRK